MQYNARTQTLNQMHGCKVLLLLHGNERCLQCNYDAKADAAMQGADVYNAVTMARGQKSPLLLSTDKCEYE